MKFFLPVPGGWSRQQDSNNPTLLTNSRTSKRLSGEAAQPESPQKKNKLPIVAKEEKQGEKKKECPLPDAGATLALTRLLTARKTEAKRTLTAGSW